MIAVSKTQITIIAVSILLFTLGFLGLYWLRTPVVTDEAGVRYIVREGASLTSVVQDFCNVKMVKPCWVFKTYARFIAKDRDLKAGEYLFKQGATPSKILHQMMTGTGMVYYTFTIVPGWNFMQLQNALNKMEVMKHTMAGLSDTEIMQRLGSQYSHPEGMFFPETYYFVRGSTDLQLLKRAYQMMQDKLHQLWQTQSLDAYFKTPYEVLIAASLIEKETHLDGERPMIAGVIINRLKKGMLLQIDPTAMYGAGRFDGTITKADLKAKNPYNTYVVKGLPPTPIAIPSVESIQAAIHPAEHDYLYFVAKEEKNDGHIFSKTLTEHHQAVLRVRKKENDHGAVQQKVSHYRGHRGRRQIYRA